MRIGLKTALICAMGIMLFAQSTSFSQQPARSGANATPIDADTERDRRLKWFRDARFGLMIHWGVYAVPAGEWKGKLIPGLGEWIMNRAKP